MDDELLKKIYGHISTNVFLMIRRIFSVSSIVSFCGAFQFSNPPFQIVSYGMFLLSIANLYPMICCRAKEFSKDYCGLDEEYQLFLNNYSELMKSLDYNTLVDLCVIFKYMYENGYLSIDGKFDKNKKQFFESYRFQMINIFNGCGICRHVSRSLNDILNYNGFSSAVMPVYTRDLELLDEKDIQFLRDYSYTILRDMSAITEENVKAIDAVIALEQDEKQLEIDELSKKELMKRNIYRESGNHLVVLTSDNDLSLVCDPMKGIFCEFTDEKKQELISEENYRYKACIEYGKYDNTPSDIKRYYHNLKLSSMNIAGLYQQTSIDRLVDNIDMVEKFRKDNIPLMESLKNKAYKLK